MTNRITSVDDTKNYDLSLYLELPFELVYTPKALALTDYPEMRNVKDSPILATAIMECIDVFLTGDKDFLVLEVIPKTMI